MMNVERYRRIFGIYQILVILLIVLSVLVFKIIAIDSGIVLAILVVNFLVDRYFDHIQAKMKSRSPENKN